jgi:hypothetical protein
MEVPLPAIKRIFSVCALALLLVPATHACNNNQTLLEENDVAFEYKIPQIDTDLPAVNETATFAMG